MFVSVISTDVMNIVGMLPSKSQLFGISWDSRAYLMSNNDGVDWFTISPQLFVEARNSPGFIPVDKVAWSETVSEVSGDWEGKHRKNSVNMIARFRTIFTISSIECS